MTRITRISGTGFPHNPHRPRAQAGETRAETTEKPKLVDPPQRRSTDRRVPNRQGPTAAFLTQYVDQHWEWPRNPGARVRARQRAAKAYGASTELDGETSPVAAIMRKA